MMNYFDKRFEGIQKKLQQPSNKNAKMENIFKFNLSSALNNDDTSEPNNLTAKLKRRNKSIKMADRSALSWDTVATYKADPIASDSDDGKNIRQAKNRPLTKQKKKSLTNLLFTFPVRDQPVSSFRSMVNIRASHLRVNETSTSDFHQTTLPRTTTFDGRNGPIAPMSYWGTRVFVVAKDSTGVNTA